ncbi:MAG: penicillin-binding protein 2 [Anaerolineales bacterium]
MRKNWIQLLLIFTLLTACAAPAGSNLPAGSALPTPVVRVTRAPDPLSGLTNYLQAWAASDYAGMYAMLSAASRAKINEEDFTKRYRGAMNAMALQKLTYSIGAPTTNPASASLKVSVTYSSAIIGDFQRDITFPLTLENGDWRIDWEEGLILPELRGGNSLSMDYSRPPRGEILDRNGAPLVKETQAVAFGMNPALISPEASGNVFYELAKVTGVTPGSLESKYNLFFGQDWYVPVGEASLEDTNRSYGVLSGMSGVIMTDYTSRFYDQGGTASQTVGYVSAVPKESLDEYLRKGYSPEALVGQMGIEKWGEQYLAGKTGGTLYVVGPDNSIVSYLGKSDAQPPSNVQLTIDEALQFQAEKAMGGMRGAAIIMERDTGRILAMVSNPKFDANLFSPGNYNSQSGLTELFNNPDQPLVNRATQGQYPLGSIFKIITMAAALESGTYTPANTYDCQYEFTELPGRTLYDWTWERTQAGFETPPSGVLTLPEGLMRSCNPWFYHIGYDLYRQGRVTAVADMARGFGLGSPTGIGVIPEEAGNVVNPPEITEAVFQAIGQGQLTVTPLQVATFIAAMGNGGTLYRPQLVEKVIAPDGSETQFFKPEARGTLPIKPETMKTIQDAMRAVIANPRGTASHRFRGMKTIIYGKTGTAESGIPGSPHSWFAAYTDSAESSGQPDIAVVVLVENRGEGSEYAAPITRRLIELYYTGRPQSLYWWESAFDITRTPTPFGFEGTLTAQPQP